MKIFFSGSQVICAERLECRSFNYVSPVNTTIMPLPALNWQPPVVKDQLLNATRLRKEYSLRQVGIRAAFLTSNDTALLILFISVTLYPDKLPLLYRHSVRNLLHAFFLTHSLVRNSGFYLVFFLLLFILYYHTKWVVSRRHWQSTGLKSTVHVIQFFDSKSTRYRNEI